MTYEYVVGRAAARRPPARDAACVAGGSATGPLATTGALQATGIARLGGSLGDSVLSRREQAAEGTTMRAPFVQWQHGGDAGTVNLAVQRQVITELIPQSLRLLAFRRDALDFL